MTSATKTGLIGEHIALTSILSIDGFFAAHTPMDSVDIIAWDNIGSLRIQVKGSTFRFSKKNSSNRQYIFNVGMGGKKKMPTKQDFDILAFVAIDERKVFFKPVYCLSKVTWRFNKSFFEKSGLEFDSWEYSVKRIREA